MDTIYTLQLGCGNNLHTCWGRKSGKQAQHSLNLKVTSGTLFDLL